AAALTRPWTGRAEERVVGSAAKADQERHDREDDPAGVEPRLVVAHPLARRRVVDGDVERADADPAARREDQDLALELEALGANSEAEDGRDRVDAEAALRVAKLDAGGERDPPVREAVPEALDRRDLLRVRDPPRAEDDRVRLCRRLADQPRHLVREVLAVAVEREGMREAGREEPDEPAPERRALAAVLSVAEDLRAGRARDVRGRVARAVVHHED